MAATESRSRAAASVDELYRQHVGEVYRYTYAVLGNHADAEDVTQTTFVNALRALERGENPRNASAGSSPSPRTSSGSAGARRRPDPPRSSSSRTWWSQRKRRRSSSTSSSVRSSGSRRASARRWSSESSRVGRIARSQGSWVSRPPPWRRCSSAPAGRWRRRSRTSSPVRARRSRCRTSSTAGSPGRSAQAGRASRRVRGLRPPRRGAEATAARIQGSCRRPVPVGLALFKGAPSASAATSLPTIGLADGARDERRGRPGRPALPVPGAGGGGATTSAGSSRSAAASRSASRWLR